MSNPENQDLTPLSGGPADVAPLGRTGPKPEHEKTADEDQDPVNWDAIAATAEFRALIKAKARFIVPATIFFTLYYFALPVLVGFFPETMKTKVGPANLAYVFALSQFFVAWAMAWLYTRVAAKWDIAAADLLGKFTGK
jgi:uncharacterized membrane protein (DUF485 family)